MSLPPAKVRGGVGAAAAAARCCSALGVLATTASSRVLSLAGYVLAIAATAPDLSELKPVDKGQISVVYAADGSRLGFVQSDILRRVDPVARDAGRPAPRHRRDRGRALLQAQGRGLQRDRPRGGQEPRVGRDRAGRLDAHPAARPRALHQGPEAQLRPQDPRGQARLGARGRSTPRPGSSTTTSTPSLRDGRGAHRDRRRGGGGDLLRQARQGARPGRVGAARRADPGALEYNPFRNPRAAIERRNEVLEKMLDNGYITRGEDEAAVSRTLDLKQAAATSSAASPTSSTTCRSS